MDPDAIYKYFSGLRSHVAVSSMIKDVTYPDTRAADKSINNNIIYRTWDECIEILKDAFNYDASESQRLKATILDAKLLKKEILQAAFPNRFDSKGRLCKLVKIEEFERDIFKETATHIYLFFVAETLCGSIFIYSITGIYSTKQ